MSTQIRKAVFPVAGLGTRFLPVTKASPKEMLPIIDKPLIQYAVEEAVDAGITDLIFIISRNKQSIAYHFDRAYELEHALKKNNKVEMLKLLQDILPSHVNCVYLRQEAPLGLGHAILKARAVVGDEPFAVLLADDLIMNAVPSCLRQMMDVFDRYGSSVVAVENVAPEDVSKYGIISAQSIDELVGQLNAIVEKPVLANAPSTQAVIGRYIMTAEIFNQLDQVVIGANGELQLTDAIATLLKQEQVYSYAFHGKRYDCGSKLDYLKATVEYALQHKEVKDAFGDYLANKEYLIK